MRAVNGACINGDGLGSEGSSVACRDLGLGQRVGAEGNVGKGHVACSVRGQGLAEGLLGNGGARQGELSTGKSQAGLSVGLGNADRSLLLVVLSVVGQSAGHVLGVNLYLDRIEVNGVAGRRRGLGQGVGAEGNGGDGVSAVAVVGGGHVHIGVTRGGTLQLEGSTCQRLLGLSIDLADHNAAGLLAVHHAVFLSLGHVGGVNVHRSARIGDLVAFGSLGFGQRVGAEGNLGQSAFAVSASGQGAFPMLACRGGAGHLELRPCQLFAGGGIALGDLDGTLHLGVGHGIGEVARYVAGINGDLNRLEGLGITCRGRGLGQRVGAEGNLGEVDLALRVGGARPAHRVAGGIVARQGEHGTRQSKAGLLVGLHHMNGCGLLGVFDLVLERGGAFHVGCINVHVGVRKGLGIAVGNRGLGKDVVAKGHVFDGGSTVSVGGHGLAHLIAVRISAHQGESGACQGIAGLLVGLGDHDVGDLFVIHCVIGKSAFHVGCIHRHGLRREGNVIASGRCGLGHGVGAEGNGGEGVGAVAVVGGGLADLDAALGSARQGKGGARQLVAGKGVGLADHYAAGLLPVRNVDGLLLLDVACVNGHVLTRVGDLVTLGSLGLGHPVVAEGNVCEDSRAIVAGGLDHAHVVTCGVLARQGELCALKKRSGDGVGLHNLHRAGHLSVDRVHGNGLGDVFGLQLDGLGLEGLGVAGGHGGLGQRVVAEGHDGEGRLALGVGGQGGAVARAGGRGSGQGEAGARQGGSGLLVGLGHVHGAGELVVGHVVVEGAVHVGSAHREGLRGKGALVACRDLGLDQGIGAEGHVAKGHVACGVGGQGLAEGLLGNGAASQGELGAGQGGSRVGVGLGHGHRGLLLIVLSVVGQALLNVCSVHRQSLSGKVDGVAGRRRGLGHGVGAEGHALEHVGAVAVVGSGHINVRTALILADQLEGSASQRSVGLGVSLVDGHRTGLLTVDYGDLLLGVHVGRSNIHRPGLGGQLVALGRLGLGQGVATEGDIDQSAHAVITGGQLPGPVLASQGGTGQGELSALKQVVVNSTLLGHLQRALVFGVDRVHGNGLGDVIGIQLDGLGLEGPGVAGGHGGLGQRVVAEGHDGEGRLALGVGGQGGAVARAGGRGSGQGEAGARQGGSGLLVGLGHVHGAGELVVGHVVVMRAVNGTCINGDGLGGEGAAVTCRDLGLGQGIGAEGHAGNSGSAVGVGGHGLAVILAGHILADQGELGAGQGGSRVGVSLRDGYGSRLLLVHCGIGEGLGNVLSSHFYVGLGEGDLITSRSSRLRELVYTEGNVLEGIGAITVVGSGLGNIFLTVGKTRQLEGGACQGIARHLSSLGHRHGTGQLAINNVDLHGGRNIVGIDSHIFARVGDVVTRGSLGLGQPVVAKRNVLEQSHAVGVGGQLLRVVVAFQLELGTGQLGAGGGVGLGHLDLALLLGVGNVNGYSGHHVGSINGYALLGGIQLVAGGSRSFLNLVRTEGHAREGVGAVAVVGGGHGHGILGLGFSGQSEGCAGQLGSGGLIRLVDGNGTGLLGVLHREGCDLLHVGGLDLHADALGRCNVSSRSAGFGQGVGAELHLGEGSNALVVSSGRNG